MNFRWRKPFPAWSLLVAMLLLPLLVAAENESTSPTPEETRSNPSNRLVLVADINGPIGPATADFVVGALDQAAEESAELLVFVMDTPGGLDASTRDIVKAILGSSVPVATWVAPEGARAASAGTYIMYASHIAAMSPATNVGAATPVAIIGGKSAEPGKQGSDSDDGEESKSDSADAMSKKAINDAVAFARGLAAKHGRNADWAEKAVREADSIPAEQALELDVIDLIAEDMNALLAGIDGRTVLVQGRDQVLNTDSVTIRKIEPDWKTRFLGVITSPTIAYILLLAGIYGLVLEGYHPGAILPGVVGAISLLLALYALQMLPVNYAGIGLIILGVILMIAEASAPSFGALGFGGVIAMVIGSIILIDTDAPGFAVSRPLIAGIALAGSAGLMAILAMALKARSRPVVSGREELTGATGEALEDFGNLGFVFVHGERWQARTEAAVQQGQAIVVTGVDGLTLRVRPVDAGKAEAK